MNVTDKLYTEWAWRTESGVPDINNPKDKATLDRLISELVTEQEESPYKVLQANLKKIANDKEAIDYINRYVNHRNHRGPFNEYVTKKQIDDSTIGDFSAPDAIFNILSKNNDVENFLTNLEKLPGFGSLGTSGNLLDKLKGIVSNDSIAALINLGGQEEGRGVGKAEIALATLCSDVKMMKNQAGDLDWNGYLEVKGTSARLGKRDHSFTGSPKIVQLAQSSNIEDEKFGRTSVYNAPEALITQLTKAKVPNETILNSLKEDLNPIYGEALDLITTSNLNNLNVVLRQVYFKSYWMREGVNHIIFVNSNPKVGNLGKFLSVNLEQGLSYIASNPTSFCSPIRFNALAPNVFRNGVGEVIKEDE